MLILEKVVSIKMTEIENIELESNLDIYASLNKMMIRQYKLMVRQLKEHGIDPDEEEDLPPVDEEEDEEMEEQAQRQVEEMRRRAEEEPISVEDYNCEESRYNSISQSAGNFGELSQPLQSDSARESKLGKKSNFMARDTASWKGMTEEAMELQNMNRASRLDTPEKVVRGKDRSGDLHAREEGGKGQTIDEYEREEDRKREGREGGLRVVDGKITINEMEAEMKMLETINKEELTLGRESLGVTERNSSVRGERRREEVLWDMTITWGREFTLAKGEYHPETCIFFEGALNLQGEKELVEMLSPEELKFLRRCELDAMDNREF